MTKQIIGSFEDIGKDIVREAAKVPGDIAGKALESLGATSGKTQQGQAVPAATDTAKPKEKTSWETFDETRDEKTKKAIARAALEALLKRTAKSKEPSVWEKIQMEVEQKKQLQQQQQVQAASQQLPKTASKRPRGDLYGVTAKKLGSEVGKNVRQD